LTLPLSLSQIPEGSYEDKREKRGDEMRGAGEGLEWIK